MQSFDNWFDTKYPINSMGAEIIRLALKEVAEEAWKASREFYNKD